MKRHPRQTSRLHAGALAAAVASVLVAHSHRAGAVLSFNVGGTWDSDSRRQAAIDSMQADVNRFNAFGNFGSYNIYVYYDAGIPTAQTNYLGSIGFGGTWPNERVSMHETSHYLGTGTTGGWPQHMINGAWNGPVTNALVRQFEGEQAVLNGDGQHYWPYGLNFDSEGSEINKQREVAVVYALRGDLGLGPTTPASSATTVNLTASDAVGESGFNYQNRWSDTHFAHAGAAYSTGNFALRTPASSNSFKFYGTSLTINNTNNVSGGLYYNGSGNTGVTTINNMTLAGGWVQHLSTVNDVFQLAGAITVTSPSVFRAKQGNINILADIKGSGNLAIATTDNMADDNRYVTLLSDNTVYSGNWSVGGRLQVGGGTTAGGLGTGSVTNNGTLVFNRGNTLTVANPISGSGKLFKRGAGTLVLSGSNTYTGATIVQSGALVLGNAAQAPVLTGAGGADVQAGRLVLDYTGGSSPADAVKDLLANAYASNFTTGQIRSSTATTRIGLGWADDTNAKQLTILRTYNGDANLDGGVNGLDFSNLASSFGTSARVWSDGDFNYDGTVNGLDFSILATNFGFIVPAQPTPVSAPVPEPAGMAVALAAGLFGSRSRRHPSRKTNG